MTDTSFLDYTDKQVSDYITELLSTSPEFQEALKKRFEDCLQYLVKQSSKQGSTFQEWLDDWLVLTPDQKCRFYVKAQKRGNVTEFAIYPSDLDESTEYLQVMGNLIIPRKDD